MPTEGASVWIDPQGYQQTINEAEQDFQKALQAQKSAIKSR
jgi:hypothetical protein